MFKKALLATTVAVFGHGANAALIGTEIGLRTIGQATPESDQIVTSFPATATVSATEVEFPDVASLEDPSVPSIPGFAGVLVDVAIDAGDDFLSIDFDNSSPFTQFASGFQNTYVFLFESEAAIAFQDATIDEDVTTLGLTPDRVNFEGNALFVNVESLPFDTSTFARISLDAETVDPTPGPTEPDDMGGGIESPTPVPLPAGLPLLLTGLGAFAMLRRRKGA
jgi:hypothetical protein